MSAVSPRAADPAGAASAGRLAPPFGAGPLFTQAPVGIAILDPSGLIIDLNPAFLRILRVDRDAVTGRPFSERLAAGEREEVNRHLARLVLGAGRAARLEAVSLVDGEGCAHPAVLDASGFERDGELCGLILVAREVVRAPAAADAALIQAQKMQAVGQLAGGIAHDFNNLLTAMIGFSDLLLTRHRDNEPGHEEVVQIRANALRAAGLVRQLLAFSRQQALTPVVVDPAAAIRDLARMLSRLLGPQIGLSLETGMEPLRVRVDPVQFDQVIINLAVNARDAMPRGGALTIRIGRCRLDAARDGGPEMVPPGDYVVIEVADTGSGIDADLLPSIFDPFFTTKAAGEGTGLGLATVYGIVRQSGGYVLADSVPGEGARFSVYLPPAASEDGDVADVHPPPQEHLQLSSDPRPEEVRPATVLLVDDEPGVRAFAAKALRRAGYRVLDAGDGDAALALVRDQDVRFDLVIADVVMPGMDGHTLIRLLGERPDPFAVILMSGYAEDVLTAAGTPAVRFLMKPFTLASLVGQVAEALADPAMRPLASPDGSTGASV